MEYLIELRFEDKHYNAMVHFVATFVAKSHSEAQVFLDELIAGFTRKGVLLFSTNFRRIDNDPILRERSYEYYEFCKSRATASMDIEQFILENPDQNKSLAGNLTEKLYNGEKSIAYIGNQYKIPVRVTDKKSRNPIANEIYYFGIEHLIPKS